jgi:Holliday junction resolvase-like predicted endonuclease
VGAVGWQKQRHLSHAARVWLSRVPTPPAEVRFDVVGVVVARGGVRVCHVENAFPLPTP